MTVLVWLRVQERREGADTCSGSCHARANLISARDGSHNSGYRICWWFPGPAPRCPVARYARKTWLLQRVEKLAGCARSAVPKGVTGAVSEKGVAPREVGQRKRQ